MKHHHIHITYLPSSLPRCPNTTSQFPVFLKYNPPNQICVVRMCMTMEPSTEVWTTYHWSHVSREEWFSFLHHLSMANSLLVLDRVLGAPCRSILELWLGWTYADLIQVIMAAVSSWMQLPRHNAGGSTSQCPSSVLSHLFCLLMMSTRVLSTSMMLSEP